MGVEREILQDVMVYGCARLKKQKPVPHRGHCDDSRWMDGLRAQVYGHKCTGTTIITSTRTTSWWTLLYFTLLYFSLLLIYRIHEYTAPSHTVIVLKSNFNSLSLDTISATSQEA